MMQSGSDAIARLLLWMSLCVLTLGSKNREQEDESGGRKRDRTQLRSRHDRQSVRRRGHAGALTDWTFVPSILVT